MSTDQRSAADITAEIETVEARLAALRLARVQALMPADWPDTVLGEVREAFREADFATYGQRRSFTLGNHVRVIVQVDVCDPGEDPTGYAVEDDAEDGE